MPWETINKTRIPGKKYTRPLVRLLWYKPNKARHYVASFHFNVLATQKLQLDGERWCEVKKDKTKLLFEFSKEEGLHTRKVTQTAPVAVRIYTAKVSLEPTSPSKNQSFLLHIKQPKKGWIDLAKPVNPEEYLE